MNMLRRSPFPRPQPLTDILLRLFGMVDQRKTRGTMPERDASGLDWHRLYLGTRDRLVEAVRQKQAIEGEKRRMSVMHRHISRLSTMGCSITACLDVDDILFAAGRHLRELMTVDVFAVGFLQPDAAIIEFPYCLTGDRRNASFCMDMHDRSHPAVRCLLSQHEVLMHHAAQAGQPPDAAMAGSSLYFPLSLKSGTRGVLCLYSERPRAYRRLDVAAVRALCSYVTVALDNAHAFLSLKNAQQGLEAENRRLEDAYRALEEVSLTDPLTGLRNRRFLQQHLDADAAITVRHYEDWRAAGRLPDSPDIDMIFFVVDIDHFKAVNDQYGHAAGDKVLVQMRERLEKVFRESDYLIRWGGEEFLVVARASSRLKAEQLAERIRHTIADTPFSIGDATSLSKTCSIGFACFPLVPSEPGLLPWQQTVQLADQALYMAKHGGRNTWFGLTNTATTASSGDAGRLVHRTLDAIQAGELRAVTRPAAECGPT